MSAPAFGWLLLALAAQTEPAVSEPYLELAAAPALAVSTLCRASSEQDCWAQGERRESRPYLLVSAAARLYPLRWLAKAPGGFGLLGELRTGEYLFPDRAEEEPTLYIGAPGEGIAPRFEHKISRLVLTAAAFYRHTFALGAHVRGEPLLLQAGPLVGYGHDRGTRYGIVGVELALRLVRFAILETSFRILPTFTASTKVPWLGRRLDMGCRGELTRFFGRLGVGYRLTYRATAFRVDGQEPIWDSSGASSYVAGANVTEWLHHEGEFALTLQL